MKLRIINFEISLVVFLQNITTNHAITLYKFNFFFCNLNLDYSTSQLSLAESLEKLGSSSLSKEADTGIGEPLDLCKKKWKKKTKQIDRSTIPDKTTWMRRFSPSCPPSYATKLFPKRCLCGKKSPSPSSMLLHTNAQGSGFLLNTQRHCFQGKGEREELVQLWCLEKCSPSIQFSQQFCSSL